MRKKLDNLEKRYEELKVLLADPKIISNISEYKEYAKELSSLENIVLKYKKIQKLEKEIEKLKSIDDLEIKEIAEEEMKTCKDKIQQLEKEIKILFTPKDPFEGRNILIEIRAGTGGDEAALFAADLFRMYVKFIEKLNWKWELINTNTNNLGGFKEVIFSVQSKKAYSNLKYEKGVHRVQRVPATEQQGRVHTSAVTVAVVPEPKDVDIKIDPNDLRIDVFRSQGHGGQSVNTTDSAVRIVHLPTNITVTCQDEKSQHKNKAKALRILKSRLYEKELRDQQEKISKDRKKQVGTGDRSEKIRTYNFPQNRVTDHRIGLTLKKLDYIINGNLEEIIDALKLAESAKAYEN